MVLPWVSGPLLVPPGPEDPPAQHELREVNPGVSAALPFPGPDRQRPLCGARCEAQFVSGRGAAEVTAPQGTGVFT